MYYLTYLSKNRRGLNVDIEKETKYNTGRFVTKAFIDKPDDVFTPELTFPLILFDNNIFPMDEPPSHVQLVMLYIRKEQSNMMENIV